MHYCVCFWTEFQFCCKYLSICLVLTFKNLQLVQTTVFCFKLSTKQLLIIDLQCLFLSPDSFYLYLSTNLSLKLYIIFPPLSPRDWIHGLSTYATSSYLRAAELGAEIGEMWLQEDAAVYMWNYSNNLLAGAKYEWLLPAFQGLVEVLQKTDYTGYIHSSWHIN